jgi:hypothetical protein
MQDWNVVGEKKSSVFWNYSHFEYTFKQIISFCHNMDMFAIKGTVFTFVHTSHDFN